MGMHKLTGDSAFNTCMSMYSQQAHLSTRGWEGGREGGREGGVVSTRDKANREGRRKGGRVKAHDMGDRNGGRVRGWTMVSMRLPDEGCLAFL